MHCPHDQTILSIRDTEGHIGYICSECHGAWLPEKYLQSIQHTHAFFYPYFARAVSESPAIPTELKCPSGCGELAKTTWHEASINLCNKCHGIWFDCGEVRALLARMPRISSAPLGTAGSVAADIGANTLVGILIAWIS